MEINDDEIIDTRLPMDDEEEVPLKGGRSTRQKPSMWKCICKWISITCAVIIFSAILITLWVQYGEYIKKRVFPPSISAMGEICRNGTGSTYLSGLKEGVNDTDIHINMTVPETPLALLFPVEPYTFHEDCLAVHTDLDCIKYIVYSM